jgi:hypothetical protein
MAKLIESCGIYLDWDNIWGGLLDFLHIKYDPKGATPLSADQKRQIEKFISDLPIKLHKVLPDIRFIKAFADFDRLPYANSLSPSITHLLYNAEMEPHPSFVKAGKTTLKDASDRTLMLETIEDVFFTQKTIDCIVIGSGDVDFYPFIQFIREHSNKSVSLISFRKTLSSFYSNISYFPKEGIHILEDLMSDHKTLMFPEKTDTPTEATTEEISLPRENIDGDEILYQKFKEELIKGVTNWNRKKEQDVKTGLVVNSWLSRWDLSLTLDQFDSFLQRMKDEKKIDIIPTNPNKPLQGKIKLIKNS